MCTLEIRVYIQKIQKKKLNMEAASGNSKNSVKNKKFVGKIPGEKSNTRLLFSDSAFFYILLVKWRGEVV